MKFTEKISRKQVLVCVFEKKNLITLNEKQDWITQIFGRFTKKNIIKISFKNDNKDSPIRELRTIPHTSLYSM